MTARDVCNTHGISEQTHYRWKRKYGDMSTSEIKHLRELEAENALLKRLPARSMTSSFLKGVLAKLLATRGKPATIRSDGPEFIAFELTEWLES